MSKKKFDYDLHFISEYGDEYYLKFYLTEYITGNTCLACNCTTNGEYWEPYAIISKNIDDIWLNNNPLSIFVDYNNIRFNLYIELLRIGLI